MKSDLLSYVETVMEIEKTVYTQSQLQQELKKKIGSLGIPRVIQSPTRETAALGDNLGAGAFVGGLIFAIIGGLFGLFTADGFFNAIFSMIGKAISGAIIGAVGGLVWGIISYFIERKRYEDDYNYNFERYKMELDEDRERVNQEKEQAKQLQQLMINIGTKRAETEDLLQEYYDIGVIHEKYRSLQGVCAIFDYLDEGICTKLEGPDGVYSQMKNDQRFRGLEMKLDTIISSLDSIKNTQVALYNAVQEGNRNVRQLIEKTDRQIRLAETRNELMAINNYNQQQQLAEARYQSALQTYAMIKWSQA